MAFVGKHIFRATSHDPVVSFCCVKKPSPIAHARLHRAPKSDLTALSRSKLTISGSFSASRLQESDLIPHMKSPLSGRGGTGSIRTLFCKKRRIPAGLNRKLRSGKKPNFVTAGVDKQNEIEVVVEGNALRALDLEKFPTHPIDVYVETDIDSDRSVEEAPQMNREMFGNRLTDDVSRTTRGIILAGEETSMVLSRMKASASLAIAANTHLVDFPINQCTKSGINKIYVLTQSNSYALNSHIHQSYGYIGVGDRSSFVEVLASKQTNTIKEWSRGSADAVRHSLEEIMDENRGLTAATDYVILPGSSIHTVDINDAIRFHRQRNADITICCTSSSNLETAKPRVVLRADPAFRVTSFEENSRLHHNSPSDTGTSELMNMDIYVFSRTALLDLLNEEKAESITHINNDVIPRALAEGMKVDAYQYNGPWYDIQTCKDYFRANMDLLCGETGATDHLLDGSFPVPLNGLTPTRFIGKVKVHNSMIGSSTLLHDCTIDHSIIGNDLVIGQGSIVSNSIIGNADSTEYVHLRENPSFPRGIGHNVTLDNCIIEDNVWIGHDSTIVNANGLQEANCMERGYIIQDSMVIILRNTIIPDGTTI